MLENGYPFDKDKSIALACKWGLSLNMQAFTLRRETALHIQVETGIIYPIIFKLFRTDYLLFNASLLLGPGGTESKNGIGVFLFVFILPILHFGR